MGIFSLKRRLEDEKIEEIKAERVLTGVSNFDLNVDFEIAMG